MLLCQFNNIIYFLIGKVIAMSETLSDQQKFYILKEIVDRFPLKCKLFLNLLLSTLPPGNSIQIPRDFKKAYSGFVQVFQKSNSDEKLYYIGQMSDHIEGCLKNSRQKTQQNVHQIETACEIKQTLMGLGYWQKKHFKYNYQLHKIRLSSSKKEEDIDLQHYLARHSTSQKNAMVLEALAKMGSEKLEKLTIKFSNSSIFREVFNNIRKNIIELSTNKLEELFGQELKESNQIEKMSQPKINSKGFTILNSKTMTQYFNEKDKIIDKLQRRRYHVVTLYNKNATKIYHSDVHRKCYYLQQTISRGAPFAFIKNSIPILNRNAQKENLVCQVLQAFTANITANYYKLDVAHKQYQLLVIVEKVEKDGYYQQIMKAATHFFLDICIEFIVITLKETAKNQYSLQIGMILQTRSKKHRQSEIISLFLALAYPNELANLKGSNKVIGFVGKENMSMVEMQNQGFGNFAVDNSVRYQTKNPYFEENLSNSSGKKDSSQISPHEEQNNEDIDQSFYTVMNDDEGQLELNVYHSLAEKMFSNKGSLLDTDKTENTLSQDMYYLKTKHNINFKPKGSLKMLNQHYLFGDWRRSTKGGVVVADQEVLKQQKRIIKLVITRIGANIFKGNSIMSVSLPIQLFRNESSLVSIARNFTYSPLLLQPSVEMKPLERMKNIVLFEISINALALSTRKPFNPILGQTYQGQIAGCPIYLEQISHHPPITSIYYLGRGYKIYGTMRLDVNLRLNYVRGINHCSLTIEYDNGDKIELEMPVMIINGLLIGERTIYYEGTVYLKDPKNMLITELTFNAANLKKGFFSFKSQSPDYLSAEVYQVSSAFMEKFNKTKTKFSPKTDTSSKVLSKIHGEWNGKIFVDQKQTLDFEQQLPVELENYSCPLQSDATLRTDIIELSKGDMNIAQDEKDRLQELQRRDKRLRQSQKTKKVK